MTGGVSRGSHRCLLSRVGRSQLGRTGVVVWTGGWVIGDDRAVFTVFALLARTRQDRSTAPVVLVVWMAAVMSVALAAGVLTVAILRRS